MPGDPNTRTASIEGHHASVPAAVAPAPRQYPRPSRTRHPSAAPDSEIWRDYPFAEIEELIAELKRKVARFALIQFADETSQPGNVAAFESMNDALEDISAAALGIELASHQALLERPGPAGTVNGLRRL
ncbi:hypothetical protein [Arthrobacter sp. FW306-04-A]|uniref:hypothetical protein n=1 Tax=Arthrobacter sp. FW306-04-A TaxID=2879619 RepID=UPI0037C06E0B|nr:hypothetical protein LFT43_03780 [Arthrobacter sp. FW306-04-A]